MTSYEQEPFSNLPVLRDPEERKCACLLLLDTSWSMTGDRIDELNKALIQFANELEVDALARKRVEVSIMTFGGTVDQPTPFISARDFRPPTLTAGGGTPMSEAITTGISCLRERVNLYRQYGPCYMPWIFLITDGEPTDSEKWHSAVQAVRDGEAQRSFLFFSVGVKEADLNRLSQLSQKGAVQLKGLHFRNLFAWLSSSLKKVSSSRPGDSVQLDSISSWTEIST